MKKIRYFMAILCIFSTVSILPALAQEPASSGEVYDLGDVLIMEKGDEVNAITSIDTLSSYDIEMQGSQTVSEALELIPGLDVQTGGKGQSYVTLRGFDQKNIKVLIDGVPANPTYDGSLDLSQIPVDAIARIKVIKGASSVLYGPNTMGGVINIITKKGGEKPFTSVRTSFGENSTQNYIFNHGAGKGNFNYWITASQRKSDGFELSDDFDPNNPVTGIGTDYNEDGGVRDLSDYEKTTVSAKFGYEYDDDSKLYMTVDYHDNERGIPTENSRYWDFKNWEQWHVSLAGEHDFTNLLSMKARLYYMKHDDTLEDVSWDAAHTTSKKWFQTSSYDDYSIGGEVQGYLDFGDISLVKMGVSYMKANNIQREYLDATSMPVIKFGDPVGWAPEQEYEVDIYSFGLEDDIRVTDKMTLTAGVSYDVHDPVKAFDGKASIDRDKTSTWNPQAGVSYDFTEDFTMYASVGKKTRFPQMKELYSDLAGGNTDLDPQQTIAYEIGATKRFNYGLSLSGALFYNDITDRIDYDVNDDLTNIGETEIKGMEAQLHYQSPWNLDLGLGYTYLSATDKADEARPELDAERIPEHKFFVDARYFFDFGLTAACQAIYTSDQVEYDKSFNPRDIDEFWVVNAKLNQDIKLFEKISTAVFLEVKNLFDEDYEEGSGPYPGRNFLAGMQFSF